jgi:hypothetical protein
MGIPQNTDPAVRIVIFLLKLYYDIHNEVYQGFAIFYLVASII